MQGEGRQGRQGLHVASSQRQSVPESGGRGARRGLSALPASSSSAAAPVAASASCRVPGSVFFAAGAAVRGPRSSVCGVRCAFHVKRGAGRRGRGTRNRADVVSGGIIRLCGRGGGHCRSSQSSRCSCGGGVVRAGSVLASASARWPACGSAAAIPGARRELMADGGPSSRRTSRSARPGRLGPRPVGHGSRTTLPRLPRARIRAWARAASASGKAAATAGRSSPAACSRHSSSRQAA